MKRPHRDASIANAHAFNFVTTQGTPMCFRFICACRNGIAGFLTVGSRRLVLLTIGLTALGLSSALAQDWPTRPVTMVIGVGPGGGADLLGRVLAERLGELLGQPVIVENVGIPVAASARVAHAPPNGYVFQLGSASTHAVHPSLYKKPLFDVINDFTPVGLVAESPFILVARKDFPANGLKEFASYAQLHQARLQFASATGIGSLNHLSCELLNAAIGIKITLVPYRDPGLAIQDMLAGRIDYQCLSPQTMIPLIQSNRVNGIAVTGKERIPQLPNLETVQEQGIAGFDVETWLAFFMPKGVPDPIVKRLNAATNEMMNTPAIEQRLRAMSTSLVSPERRSPDYLRNFLVSEVHKWAIPIKAAGIFLD